MGIYGIGTDIVKTERIEKLWEEHGISFAKKILTADELLEFAQETRAQVGFLAKRFAAKEAVAKALGTGFRDVVLLKQIGIASNELGKPSIVLCGSTKDYVTSLGNLDLHVSLADEQEYVIAFVIISKT